MARIVKKLGWCRTLIALLLRAGLVSVQAPLYIKAIEKLITKKLLGLIFS